MSKELKLCEDCVYFTPNTEGWSTEPFQRMYAICAKTSLVTRSTGNKCSNERLSIFRCGKRARNFKEAIK